MNLFTNKVATLALGTLLATCMTITSFATAAAQVDENLTNHPVGGVTVAEPQKAWGPSYERDDPALVYGNEHISAVPELRWGPSYAEDDPALIYGNRPNIEQNEQRWGPSYDGND